MGTQVEQAPDPRGGLLDAAEEVLARHGYPAATTRAIARQAGLNHGLVHYYFGSVDNLLLATLRRFTDRLQDRQRELYAQEIPFIEKWRTAMVHLVETDNRYSKIWMELQALSWNKPEFQEHLVAVNRDWREILTGAFAAAAAEYGVDGSAFPIEGIVALVMTFNLGVQIENLGGVSAGHHELLEMIDRMLVDLEEGK